MKNEENYLRGFSYSKNMANFEAFRWVISTSLNLLFLKSDKRSEFPTFLLHFCTKAIVKKRFVKKIIWFLKMSIMMTDEPIKKSLEGNFQLLHHKQIGNILQRISPFTHFCIKLCRIFKSQILIKLQNYFWNWWY